jgi:hypothetical protein
LSAGALPPSSLGSPGGPLPFPFPGSSGGPFPFPLPPLDTFAAVLSVDDES